MNTSRGYSLLEVMISMVILAIAFLALIATQYGALNGYVSARDAQQAAELGRRTSEILRIQGSQWITNFDDGDNATINTFNSMDPYLSTGPTPFDTANPIAAIRSAAGNTWVALVNVPVDTRFNRLSATTNPTHLGGKYCIYARGADFGSQFASLSGDPVVAAMRFQIAIVYPGPRATLVDCTTVTALELDTVGDPTVDPYVAPPLEARGLRALYVGTVVVRRAHLTQFTSGS